jgi:predicted nucleic acid-binding protein
MLVSRQGPVVAFDYLNGIDHGPTTVVRVTGADEASAREILRTYRDKAFSLTDALSFVVMEAFGITTAFSFDDDFRQYGFATL